MRAWHNGQLLDEPSPATGARPITSAALSVTDHRVQWARITVHKPDAPIDAIYSDVALTITRQAEKKGRGPT